MCIRDRLYTIVVIRVTAEIVDYMDNTNTDGSVSTVVQ